MEAKTASIVAFLLLATAVSALRDSGYSSYGTYVNKRCEPNNSKCCAHHGKCEIGYRMNGSWFTERDTSAANYNCNTECQNHFNKCRAACAHASRTSEIITGPHCKCKRNPAVTITLIRASCYAVCLKARADCITGCVKGPKCPLRARTIASWRRVYSGTCALYCQSATALKAIRQQCSVRTSSRESEKVAEPISNVDDNEHIPEENLVHEN